MEYPILIEIKYFPDLVLTRIILTEFTSHYVYIILTAVNVTFFYFITSNSYYIYCYYK